MDYEKAYKESFEAAKGLHEAGNALTKMQMEVVFPQLAESDDERTRKEIIHYLFYAAGGLSIEEQNRWIAYLEKQKEPHFTKRNALFDKCVENCDPEIMKRVSDEVDEMLKKEQKPIEYLPKEKVYAIMTKLTELSTSSLIPINSPEYLKIHQITKDVRSLLDYPIEQKPADDKAFEEWIDDWWQHNKVNNPDSYDKGNEIQFDERGFKNIKVHS